MPLLDNLESSPDVQAQLIELLRKTWRFDFASDECADAAAQFYLAHCTEDSTHAFVVRDADDIAAVLFGTIPSAAPLRFCRPDLAHCRSRFIQCAGPEGFLAWCEDWLAIPEALFAQWHCSHPRRRDARIDLLVTDPRFQGRGFGRELVDRFESAVRQADAVDGIILQTDTWCGWRFYEKLGYARTFERALTSDDDAQAGAYFLYAKTPQR